MLCPKYKLTNATTKATGGGQIQGPTPVPRFEGMTRRGVGGRERVSEVLLLPNFISTIG